MESPEGFTTLILPVNPPARRLRIAWLPPALGRRAEAPTTATCFGVNSESSRGVDARAGMAPPSDCCVTRTVQQAWVKREISREPPFRRRNLVRRRAAPVVGEKQEA